MERARFGYTILNLAMLGAVLWFVRASRLRRARPDERQDLEENALVGADWERVRRERCLPANCPRLIGQRQRPRKDVTCEVCATTFLEQRLQRLLSAPSPTEPTASEPVWMRDSLSGRVGGSLAAPIEEPVEVASPLMRGGRHGRHRRRATTSAAQLGAVRVGLGLACVAVGAIVAALGGLLWLIVPGCLLVFVGLGLIAAGVSLDAD
jgi:hypothetical protein